jgi:hypothetical protein
MEEWPGEGLGPGPSKYWISWIPNTTDRIYSGIPMDSGAF